LPNLWAQCAPLSFRSANTLWTPDSQLWQIAAAWFAELRDRREPCPTRRTHGVAGLRWARNPDMRKKFRELTYASPSDPRLKRWVIHAIEGLSGRERFLPLYRYWHDHIVPRSPRMWGDVLDLVDVKLDIDSAGQPWPPPISPTTPLVMIANHPFGIGDGLAILALAEQLERPFKVLINNQLLRVPEIRPFSLPIDFEETREAQVTNLKSRKEALAALASGTTIIVFPAGGVATAKTPFGKAVDLPWKLFTARMIQSAKASVLPIWFEGQNGPLFQLASRFSLTLRLSLLVSEFRRFAGSILKVRIGDIIPFEELKNRNDRKLLTDELHEIVHRLASHEQRGPRLRKVRRKVKGVGRLARQKVKRVGRMASRKALGVGRLARQKIKHGSRRDRTGANRSSGLSL
jgi:putative hemolysin